MDTLSLVVFCLAVFLGSYVQSVAGFAMGMIIMATCGAVGTIDLAVLAAVVSLVSGLNILFTLRGRIAQIDRALLRKLVAGQVPAIVLGVWLVNHLSRNAETTLQTMLGIFIASGGLSLMFRRHPQATTSPPWACVIAGMGGGLFGGLFAASGPVIGWFMYRQPLALPTIRATLLAYFAVSTVARTIIVGCAGGLHGQVWQLSAIGVPIVLLGAWLGRVRPPPVSDAHIKRAVTVLLTLMGLYIVASAWW